MGVTCSRPPRRCWPPKWTPSPSGSRWTLPFSSGSFLPLVGRQNGASPLPWSRSTGSATSAWGCPSLSFPSGRLRTPAGGRWGGGCRGAGAEAGLVDEFLVEVAGDGLPEWSARVVRTYGDLLPGELGLIRDSWGQAALALNGASASELLGARLGAVVTLAPAIGAVTGGERTGTPDGAAAGGAEATTAPGESGPLE